MKRLIAEIKSYIRDLKSGEKKFSKDGMLILFVGGVLIYVMLLPTNNNSSYNKDITEEKEQMKMEYVQEIVT